MVNIPLFTGFCTSQVVQDFFHQQYCQIRITFMMSQVTSGSVLRFRIGPENRPKPKRKGSSPNHHFSGFQGGYHPMIQTSPLFTIHSCCGHHSRTSSGGGGGGGLNQRQKGPLHKFRAMSETQNFRDGKLLVGANGGLGSIGAYFTAVKWEVFRVQYSSYHHHLANLQDDPSAWFFDFI